MTQLRAEQCFCCAASVYCLCLLCVMLQGLIAMVGAFPTLKEDYDQALRLIRRIWVAQFDVSEENR